jgi:hypothetical protein
MAYDQGDQGKNMFLGREWRAGGSVGRTIYAQLGADPDPDRDPLLGLMDTPELAQAVVAAHNAALRSDP